MGLNTEMQFTVPIKPDEHGFTGRQCPSDGCTKYFKIQFGTGKQDISHCYCPYCGHKAEQNDFFTEEQIEYARSVGIKKVLKRIEPEFKKLERKFGGGFFSIKVDTRRLRHRVKHYYERELETEVVCDNCTLRYAIYGVHGFCPDCGVHNSLQIFQTNLSVIQRFLTLTDPTDSQISERVIGNALEDVVSEFQSFGKVTLSAIASQRNISDTCNSPGFQNLEYARKWFRSELGIDIAKDISSDEWITVLRCFQKRHILAHCAGVADEAYVTKAQDPHAVVGRKIRIEKEEIVDLIGRLEKVARTIYNSQIARD